MNVELTRADLERDEGLRLKPYRDSIGKLTIGVGRNLDDKGISKEEAREMLETDIWDAVKDLDRNIPWWKDTPEPQQRGLINMCFNLGWPRLSKFTKMLDALKAGDGEKAAVEALDSNWAKQVGARAERIAKLFGDHLHLEHNPKE